MLHGKGQDTQPAPKPSSGNDGDQQRTQKTTPPSPAQSFTPTVSSPAPQSPSYQIQHLIMSRNSMPGQNVNITLQNVGPVVPGSQQITLTSLPITSPASPGFQFNTQPRRFEHGSPSYIQVTSPVSQQVQTQNSTQPNTVPIQALQGVRTGTSSASLGMCSQSPTRGFVDAGLLVRQLSLGPSNTGTFVIQEGSGITQIAQSAQVHLSPGTPTVPAHNLLHSSSPTVGPVHQFGSQNSVTGSVNVQSPSTPSQLTTNLSQQLSSIIQGQLIQQQQQQQVLHGQQVSRTFSFDGTSSGMIAGVTGTSAFGITSAATPTSPSRVTGPQARSSLPLTTTLGTTLKRQARKLEEIPPATQEDALLRKLCFDYHHQQMQALKETYTEYLIELFFLQHCQGNMMDFLPFKKKRNIYQNFLRQNDLDMEVDEEEADKNSSRAIYMQTPDPSASSVIETPADMEIQVSNMLETASDPAMKQSQSPMVTLGLPLLPPVTGRNAMDGTKPAGSCPTPHNNLINYRYQALAGMSPSKQTSASVGSKLKDPTKVSILQNAAGAQSPFRTQLPTTPVSSVQTTMHLAQQQQLITEAQSHTIAKQQSPGIVSQTLLHTQNSQPSQEKMVDHFSSLKPPPVPASASKMGSDSVKTTVPVGLKPASLTSSSPSIPDSLPPSVAVSPKRILSPGASKALSPASRSPGLAGPQSQESQSLAPVPGDAQQEALIPKPVEQESYIHQRIAELRKEGMWSPRRLPRLQEPCRTKSHWDYLLEEMSWMAADFAQERIWKQACAKKLVRTAARHCQEKEQKDARAKKEDEDRLRRIAWLAAREIQYFWSNIEQVVEIKLQVELQEKMKRAFSAQKKTQKGLEPKKLDSQIIVDAAVSGAKINVENNENAVNVDANQKAVVSIEALLTIEGTNTAQLGARKHSRDIAEVAAAAELLLPRGSSRISCLVKTSQLSLLHGILREYQQVGMEWLVKQYKKNLNGILADETGLGKNIQVIALFAHLASNEGVWGPYLIVARSCKILKWELELKRWCPSLKILLYFGSQSELRRKRQMWNEPNNFNVCITSYKQFFKGHKAFMKMRWKYLVLDEVHQIKNMTEKHWEAILNLPSQRRLLLRDNPLPHTWKELWTMVHFVIPGLSRAYLDFPVKDSDQDHDYRHTISIRLHRSTQPFILRRSKRDVERQLTKKSEHVLKCQLSNRQRALYEDVMMQPGTQDALKGGHFVSVLHVLMQLQRICNHPELVDPRLKHSSYASEAIKYKTASLILRALLHDPWKNVDLASFLLIGMENKMTRYESQVLPKQKVTRKLIQEIYNSPDPAVRLGHVKIKPSRLFEPVLYGQKPEGRTVNFPSASQTRTVTPTTTTVSQQGQVRRSPVTTPAVPQGAKAPATQISTPHVQVGAPRPQAPVAFATAAPVRQLSQPPQQSIPSPRLVLSSQARLPTGELVKIAQLASTGGAQGRVAQPETPVTLQFQGNKFTLSQSQLRQLTAGQPLQLHGNVLQIVSAPGQYLRPQGSVVLPTMPQGTATNAVRNQHPVGAPLPSTGSSTGLVAGRNIQAFSTTADSVPKTAQAAVCPAQESAEEKQRVIKERLDRLFVYNELRCARSPIYGTDLLSLCSLNSSGAQPLSLGTVWSWTGSVNCFHSSCSPENSNNLLHHLILSHDQQKTALEPLAISALCVVPTVVAAPPILTVPNPPAAYVHSLKMLEHGLRDQLAPVLPELRERTTPNCLPFPDLKLIQTDSGKLDALAVLLRKLRSEGRRVLIFSQMLLMLDILERFLDFHSLTFLRIDDHANSEQCQDLMKTFNKDQRIFCVLLSTHIPNLGAYQVEADTVIFYDSDLNPVMDGKTQSWCDLVGRSKDIHVYRLVSANSIEEKLLRNGTKDLIREVAAQGSDYSLAFLTQQTIQELFEDCSPLDDSGFRVKAEEFVLLSQEPSPSDTITAKVAKPFVEALVEIECIEEDITDPVEEDPNPTTGISYAHSGEPADLPGPSQFQELVELMQQLTPIEKYALHYLELFHVQRAEAHDECTEEKLNAAKREWDSKHLRELKEREDMMQCEAEGEEELLTYTREDAYNMDFIYDGPDEQTEIMPVWTPPTPPQDENDIYIDSVMCLMYDTNPIVESKLPPVYMRKERKRHKTDPAGRKKKMRHGESVVPPRSLFDRAAPNPLKVRKEGKEQKKNILLKQQTQFAKPLPTLIKPVMESGPDNPEWLISEDWALLQAVKQLLELPLNLSVMSPAHTPNWDLVSDVVNSCSRIYRSSKQCRSRYENVIIPREEGKLLYDVSPKKKSENLFKTKPLRTSQIYAQDEGITHIQLFATRFELMKIIAGKRSQPSKPILGGNPFQKNPKHASVLAESGINYDKPLPPTQVASLRADRIAKEKKALVEQARAQQQSGPAQPQPQQNGQQPAPTAAVLPVQSQAQQLTVTQSQVVVQQQPAPKAPSTSTTPISSPALLTGAIKTAVPGTTIATGTVSGSVVVSGVPPATFQSINKRLVSPVVAASVSNATAQMVQQRTAATATLPTEMVTIATSQGVRAVTSVTGGAVVTTNLTPVQTQARAVVTQVTTATTGGVQGTSKTLTPAQLQIFRSQQASQMQVPQIQAQASGQIKAVTKVSQEQLLKLQKQKLQQVTQTGTLAGTAQVQVQPQQTQQLATVTASRAGTVLASTTMTNLQVARLLQAQSQIQAQSGQTAQVALAKPPVVSAVVSPGGVTTLPVTVAGISVSINQPHKAAGGQTVVAQPLHMQQVLKVKHPTQQQQKALQSQTPLGQQKPYLSLQITTPQVSTASQQQKVTYATQQGIKTQFLTTSLSQAQKAVGTQQVQAQIQVAKIPQVVQQQAAIATLQQVVSASQQVQPQTVTLTQATAPGQPQVQMIQAHVVQQKLQQVIAAAASPQIQAADGQSTAMGLVSADAQNQQAKLQVRPPTVRIKAPTKPS
ncbi:E1A-binding protein p400 isoform X2 [Xenopus laevis]|uniref:E1A-binding protein p400 isoform X2 n=1 Tax=Xenopus laevis TaxID=8355 RepID=A0A8J1L0P3_XENLA|nr:E1A-binding protein p400 isoform X2 [Xenopus laevis]